MELLREMETDATLFFRRITPSNQGDSRFYRVPVLAAVDPERFVASLLAQHPTNQRTIFTALKTRYEHDRLDRDLPTERPWVNEVREKLLATTDAMSPMEAYRVRAHIKWSLDPILGIKGEREAEVHA